MSTFRSTQIHTRKLTKLKQGNNKEKENLSANPIGTKAFSNYNW